MSGNSATLPGGSFLRWAGGKSRLIDRIAAAMPDGREQLRLIEPFVGAGNVAMGIPFGRYLLNDINPDLINLFAQIGSDSAGFTQLAEPLFRTGNDTKTAYLSKRERFNALPLGVERAALFLYLNHFGYNGLCRYNKRGKFNVPVGRRLSTVQFPAAGIERFAAMASRVALACRPFSEIMAIAGRGDVAYLDPPYIPLSASASFTAYSGTSFTLADQEALASCAREAAARGAYVLISNHDTPLTRELYAGATEIQSFPVRRFISRNANNRQPALELLAIFRPAEQAALANAAWACACGQQSCRNNDSLFADHAQPAPGEPMADINIISCISDEGRAFYAKGHVSIDVFMAALRSEVDGDDPVLSAQPEHCWVRTCRDFGEQRAILAAAKPESRGAFRVTWIEVGH